MEGHRALALSTDIPLQSDYPLFLLDRSGGTYTVLPDCTPNVDDRAGTSASMRLQILIQRRASY